MPSDPFDFECDRLSEVVDKMLFERLRWERNEGPMLARLVSLARGALEARCEFELTEEGATADLKRFVLKVHGNRVMAVAIWLENGRVNVRAEPIERSKFAIAPGPVILADYSAVDEAWMVTTLQELFGRV